MTTQDRFLLIEEEKTLLLDNETEKSYENNDVALWILLVFLILIIVIVCVEFTYIAVNMNKNLGSTLISTFDFYPGQFLQNEAFFLQFTNQGILQLKSATLGIYWQSTNVQNYSTYGLVAHFYSDGSLAVENYYGEILWSVVPSDGTHAPPFIMHLNKLGQINIRSSADGVEVISLPPVEP